MIVYYHKAVPIFKLHSKLEEEGRGIDSCNIAGAAEGLNNIFLPRQRVVIRDCNLIKGSEVNNQTTLRFAINYTLNNKDWGSKRHRSLSLFEAALLI